MFPPVLAADDSTPLAPFLMPDRPIEIQCEANDSYAICYEKARAEYNRASCNGNGVGSCGTTTLSAADSLSTTLTVAKDYTPPNFVSLSLSTTSGSEADATTVTVTATATAAVEGAKTVTVVVSGTDITNGDYNLPNPTITIQNGSTTGTTNFTVVDDATVESTETATLTLSNPSTGLILGDTITANITITDNDVAKQDQTITFTPPTNKTFGDAPFAVSATSTSNLDVAISSTTTAVCAIDNSNEVTLLKAGTCTLKAEQLGNDQFNAATPVTKDITVAQANQTTTSGGGAMSLIGLLFGSALFGMAAYRRRSQLPSARA